MSKKQSRVVRSSSLGDIGLFNNVQAIETPAAVSRPVKPKQREPPPPPPHRGILTVGSPPRESDEDGDDIGKGFGVFLQSCFYCKKELSPSKDVFMAGYVCCMLYDVFIDFIDILFFCFRVFPKTTFFFLF